MRMILLTMCLLVNFMAVAQQKKAKPDKDIIASYQDGLSVVKQLNPVKYKKKPVKIKKAIYEQDSAGAKPPEIIEETVMDDKIYVGISAEAIQTFAPDLVTPFINEEGEEALSIDHHKLTYLLINAVKEQQVLIEELQAALKLKK